MRSNPTALRNCVLVFVWTQVFMSLDKFWGRCLLGLPGRLDHFMFPPAVGEGVFLCILTGIWWCHRFLFQPFSGCAASSQWLWFACPWRQTTVTSFHVLVCWLCTLLREGTSCLHPRLFAHFLVGLFAPHCWVLRVLCPRCKSFIRCVLCSHFLALSVSSFHPLKRIFHWAEVVRFDEVVFLWWTQLLASSLRTLLPNLDPRDLLFSLNVL